MKKLLLLPVLFFILSCDKNCDEEITELTKKYQGAIFRSGGNTAAVLKLHAEYQFKLGELNERCD